MTAAPDPFPRTPARPRLPYPATSVYTDVFRDNAFDADSAGPASLSVDAGAFLVAKRLGIGAYLQGTGAWTVRCADAVVSTYGEGLFVVPGGADASRITVSPRAALSGKIGIVAASGAVTENAGTVVDKSTDVTRGPKSSAARGRDFAARVKHIGHEPTVRAMAPPPWPDGEAADPLRWGAAST